VKSNSNVGTKGRDGIVIDESGVEEKTQLRCRQRQMQGIRAGWSERQRWVPLRRQCFDVGSDGEVFEWGCWLNEICGGGDGGADVG
jgi:hypothetical protein